ncbi:nitrite reductase [Neolentinus lepideus HHB14362 ss-1]|uniref:Nitrite reductase [NAD(P)H] n=1 Tax=Neolentinus lepideus HHB14362 ss-1 TaxID=1314782 RepID=A0A165VW68_9AGAM|nr:nitrite reductase [Neolentinus lepideus HHB14362 ss-1]
MVGIAFIEKLLNLDEAMRYRIVTCGEEMHLAYNRVALTDYFQHRSVEKLYLNQADWYAKQDSERFMFYTGEQVISLDPAAHTVTTSKGRTIKYDYCVLATGSVSTLPPYIPPERAAKMQGVFVYRNISDLDSILAYADKDGVKGGKTVVIGGGLLGLEAAKAVYDLETIAKVSIVNRQAYPLSRQLDEEGGEIVLRRIENMGVEVLTNITVKDITTADDGTFSGLEMSDGRHVDAQMVIYAIGITPRDDLGRAAGLKCHEKGGIVVDDSLKTSAEDVFAIGECASWRGNTYGLIAPGVEMADILSFNFTQTETSIGGFKSRQMNAPDLSTKLKLMGVDVASFGDYFVDKNLDRRHTKKSTASVEVTAPSTSTPLSWNQTNGNKPKPVWEIKEDQSGGLKGTIITTEAETAADEKSKSGHAKKKQDAFEGPIESLTYRDPFSFVYKKYIFSADGKYLLGGMMVGDTSDYVKLVALVKKKKLIEVPPSQFILGVEKKGEDEGADLDDDTQICNCHNVLKGTIAQCIKDGVDTISDLKAKTKVGTGCGGCIPLVTNIFKAEMKKAGHALNNNLCPHFAMSRQELFTVVKLRHLKTFTEVMESVGVNKDSVGCEICKPAIGSILSSLYNEHVMNPVHHANQDTNDRYMANIQRNGTFSVIPRVAAGEITPEKLIVLGQVAKKCKCIQQRIDLFGAKKQDLPDIWEELIAAGFESGHAYGKALRTVKSCVGTTWCRYGIGDSVGLAIELEERYKGIRSPHKLKGGVSGCVRECAEAQSKDFGLIATDKGWNVFLAGNGGSNPRHATLFATDVPPSKVIRIIDRFLMYYIRTADKLMRTARWVEQFEGGIERLKKILLDDELGICAELEKEMDELVGTYYDEWAAVVKDLTRRKQFRQFVNTDESSPQMEMIQERNQTRPANWPKTFPPAKLHVSNIRTPKSEWKWREVAATEDLMPTRAGTTSAAVKYGDSQLAIFHIPKRGYYATQQMCPHKRAFVLDHGIVGDDPNGNVYISCPLHKRNYKLDNGECLNDNNYSIIAFDVKEENGKLSLLLPQPDELDAVIGTSKWMVRKATAEVVERGGGDALEIAEVRDEADVDVSAGSGCTGNNCGGGKLMDW